MRNMKSLHSLLALGLLFVPGRPINRSYEEAGGLPKPEPASTLPNLKVQDVPKGHKIIEVEFSYPFKDHTVFVKAQISGGTPRAIHKNRARLDKQLSEYIARLTLSDLQRNSLFSVIPNPAKND